MLLGEAVAQEYALLAQQNLVPAPSKTGVLLAGDLYSAPNADLRGASGDVFGVWQAFANAFAWVVGVQGNHDTYSQDPNKLENAYLLDAYGLDGYLLDAYGLAGYCAKFSGLSIIAGISGIIGNPSKNARRKEAEYLAVLNTVLQSQPDILILHPAPYINEKQRGEKEIALQLKSHHNCITLCGHVHWENLLSYLNITHPVLNLDKRVIILTTN